VAKIKVLPDQIANRIAAGEVVERPASVAKELVENSLDAGSRRVRVVVEAGGRALVEVSDDGEGMDREDLLLCLERHATSKLGAQTALEGIDTLGFRGEAIPAIASVSLMRITTGTGESDPGWRVTVRAGRTEAVDQVAGTGGTTVEVRSLFFNTPARRKFMRSEQRETALLTETILQLALARPECEFTLLSNGKKVLHARPSSSREGRVRDLIGRGVELLHAAGEGDGVVVEGYISGLGQSRSDRSFQRLIVNGRPVRDRTLSHAIAEAYGPVLPPGRYPIVTLFVELPADGLDVNVHPAKNEVRFRRPGVVHRTVLTTLRESLRASGAAPSIGRFESWSGTGVGGAKSVLDVPTLPVDSAHSLGHTSIAEPAAGEELGTGHGAEPVVPSGRPVTVDHPVPLAQYRDSYIVAADGEGLLLVDQHAAHERVLFELLLDRYRTSSSHRQPLLTPETVELTAAEMQVLEGAASGLRKLGLEVEVFGPNEGIVRALPEPFAGRDPARLLREILGDLARDRLIVEDDREEEEAERLDEPGMERFPQQGVLDAEVRRFAASAACQAAIKINHPLTREKMTWLLGELARCRVRTTCPHGRPVTLRMAHGAIEKAFLRA
jgi:DNA mismatch repair protein MutL